MLDCHIELVAKIEAFLADSGMSATYFGKKAAGNSEVLARLKSGKTITVVVEQRLLLFIKDYQARAA